MKERSVDIWRSAMKQVTVQRVQFPMQTMSLGPINVSALSTFAFVN